MPRQAYKDSEQKTIRWTPKSLDVEPRSYALAKAAAAEQGIEVRVFLHNAIGREIRRHWARKGRVR